MFSDLDGTLLDTLDDLTSSVNAALEAFGCPVRSREEVRGFVGNGIRLLVRRAAPCGAISRGYSRRLRRITPRIVSIKQSRTRASRSC